MLVKSGALFVAGEDEEKFRPVGISLRFEPAASWKIDQTFSLSNIPDEEWPLRNNWNASNFLFVKTSQS